MLVLPALWNGFPLLQFDTGGYFARWHEGTLEESRSTVYGLFLNLFQWPDFWPAVVVQAGATAWVLSLVLRVHGFERMRVLLATIAALVILREKVLRPILAGVSKPKMGRKPKHWSPIDEHYEAIRQDTFILFQDLRIAA